VWSKDSLLHLDIFTNWHMYKSVADFAAWLISTASNQQSIQSHEIKLRVVWKHFTISKNNKHTNSWTLNQYRRDDVVIHHAKHFNSYFLDLPELACDPVVKQIYIIIIIHFNQFHSQSIFNHKHAHTRELPRLVMKFNWRPSYLGWRHTRLKICNFIPSCNHAM